ncbi:hypothetical protein IMG5_133620, partial [Ichthyophthirius multifiliis]
MLQQMAPKVSTDLYNINVQGKNGKRVLLQQKKRVLNERNLAGDQVTTEYEASLMDNKQTSLSTQYQISKVNENQTEEQTLYMQKLLMEVGGILQSQVSSIIKMQDNNEGEENFFKTIEIHQEVTLTFSSQQEEVTEEFLKKITETQSNMTKFKLTFEQAVQIYQQIFKINKVEIPKELKQQRALMKKNEDQVQVGQTVKQKIFRQNINLAEIGLDISSSCSQSKNINGEDTCNFGLIGTFNGNQVDLFNKQINFSASKLFKLYQMMVKLMQIDAGKINDLIKAKLDNIRQSLKKILEQIVELINFQKNPILVETSQKIQIDQQEIATQMNEFEESLLQIIENLKQIMEKPIENLKEKFQKFLETKEAKINKFVQKIHDFMDKNLDILLKNLNEQSQASTSQNQIKKIQDILEKLNQEVKELFDQEFQSYQQQFEDSINKAKDDFLGIKETFNQLKSQFDDEQKISIVEKLNDFIISAGFTDNLQKIINYAISNISKSQNTSEALSASVIQQYEPKINMIKEKLKQLQEIENIPQDIQQQSEAQKIAELIAKIKEQIKLQEQEEIQQFKNELEQLISSIKQQLSQEIKDSMSPNIVKLGNIPNELVNVSLEKAGKVALQIKNILEEVQGKVVEFTQQLDQNTTITEDDVRQLFEDLKEQIQNFQSTEDGQLLDINMYNNVDNIFTSIQSLIQSNLNEGNENGQAIMEQIKSLNEVPQKITDFYKNLQDLQLSAFTYFQKSNNKFKNINQEGLQLYNQISSQFKAAQTNFENSNQRLLQQLEGQDQQAQLQMLQDQTQGVFSKIILFDDTLKDQGKNTKALFFQKLQEIASTLEFQKQENISSFEIPLSFTQSYVTPIGITINLQAQINLINQITFMVEYKKGILNLTTTLSSKIKIKSSVSGQTHIAEVGGFLQGTIFDGFLTQNLQLNVMNRFKGNLSIHSQLNASTLKLGFYQTDFIIKESFQCITNATLVKDTKEGTKEGTKEDDPKKRLLEQAGQQHIKTNVNSVLAVLELWIQKATEQLKIALDLAKSEQQKFDQQAKQLNQEADEKTKQAAQDASNDKIQQQAESAKQLATQAQANADQAATKVEQATKDYADATQKAMQDCQKDKQCGIEIKDLSEVLKCQRQLFLQPKKLILLMKQNYKIKVRKIKNYKKQQYKDIEIIFLYINIILFIYIYKYIQIYINIYIQINICINIQIYNYYKLQK